MAGFVPPRPPSRMQFFAPLQESLIPKHYERVEFAYVASKYGHANQWRDGGSRYFDHPKAAAWIYIDELHGRDPRAIIVILLHDIPEESGLLSPYRIRVNFGAYIARDLYALTKLRAPNKETAEQYLKRVIERGRYAILAKLCDRLHNIRTLAVCTPDKQEAQVHETLTYHLPMLVPALATFGGVWEIYAYKLERMIREALQNYKDYV